ncbi:DUF4198 domain-containing protein [Sediminibacterium roseum]|uniref:DUF4198 domain-containing protein n=1 Tax=Sediminibacterium roseum TaxID=1978412 RepID=A0ABX0A4B0_9BACT|nr:DUF4198 domain-containing protein [Sediminibacterium roseum]NCI52011.1 DUF4198 domain-containing protein [Sediminibacterium roseum]
MKKYLIAIAFCIMIVSVFAHEYILLAAKFRVNEGDILEMHLFVADGLNIQIERPYQKPQTLSFELLTKNGKTDLSNSENGTLPILTRKVDFTGGGLLHSERNYARISLATDKFFDYLIEDHLDGIAGKVDKTKKEQKERYTRYIKSLVQSEKDYSDTMYKTVIGQKFEIVLLDNPYKLAVGGTLHAKAYFNGSPIKGKIITARNRIGSEPASVVTGRTDANGNCTFKITRKGDWVLHATHMIPCPDKSDSDWESFWASYSFGIVD